MGFEEQDNIDMQENNENGNAFMTSQSTENLDKPQKNFLVEA